MERVRRFVVIRWIEEVEKMSVYEYVVLDVGVCFMGL